MQNKAAAIVTVAAFEFRGEIRTASSRPTRAAIDEMGFKCDTTKTVSFTAFSMDRDRS
jgi:hypothetical protein